MTISRGSHFAAAADRIGKVYDDAAKAIPEIDLDQKAMGDLFADMSTEGEKFITGYVNKYPNLATGKITKEQSLTN